MEYELTSQKIDDNTSLVKNKHTNEPVAVLTKSKNSYPRNQVSAQWHPDFKLLHPEAHENLTTRNFGKPFDSASDAVAQLTNKSRPYVTGSKTPKDPVKTEYQGTVPAKNSYGEDTTLHKWHIHDDDGKVIGSITSSHGPDTIHSESPVKIGITSSTMASIPDSVKEAAGKKYPSESLSHGMARFRYMLDNKGKEPRFIGTQASKDSRADIFKTKLNPEESSKAYEDHLRTIHKDGYTFTRHSPVSFSAFKPANSVYGEAHQHHVISMPGEVHHIYSRMSHPDYASGTRNSQIIESYVPDPNRIFNKQSLEEHLVSSDARINNGRISLKNLKQVISYKLGQ